MGLMIGNFRNWEIPGSNSSESPVILSLPPEVLGLFIEM